MESVTRDERFGHADPAWRVPLALPTSSLSIDEIRPGDIVYTRRPKGYQRLTALAGDTWRHVGIATTVSGYPWLLEMAHFGRLGRPLTSVVPGYDTVAVQRLTGCEHQCRITLVNRVAEILNTPMKFHSRPEQAGIGLLSWSRLIRRPGPVTERARRLLTERLVQRPGFDQRAVCTTAIAHSVTALCDAHHADLDVSSPKHESPREAAKPGHHQFSMPDDIWRALQATSDLFWIKKDGVEFEPGPHVLEPNGREEGGLAMAI